MEQITAIGLDVAVVVTIAVCIYGAAKKGFIRTVIQMAAYIGILMLSMTVSRVAAPVIYTRMVEPALLERYQEQTQMSSSDADEAAQEEKDNAALVSLRGEHATNVQAVLLTAAAPISEPSAQSSAQEDTPPDSTGEQDDGREAVRGVIDEVLGQLETSGAQFGALLHERLAELDLDKIDLGALDLESLGLDELARENAGGLDALIPPALRMEIMQEITNQTVRPAAIGALQVICFAVTFGILSLVVNLLLAALGVVRYLPLIGRINAFFGGIVGLLQGLLLVWVAALLLYGVIQLCGGSWWIFSNDMLEQSMLLRYFVVTGVIGS